MAGMYPLEPIDSSNQITVQQYSDRIYSIRFSDWHKSAEDCERQDFAVAALLCGGA